MNGSMVRLVILCLTCAASFSAFAQGAAATSAQMRQLEERVSKLSAQVEEMLAANDALRRRVQELEEENRGLSRKVNQGGNASASPSDLAELSKAIDKQIRLVDENRVKGDEALLKELNSRFKEIRELLAKGGGTSTPPSGNFIPYVIQSGDTLDAIRRALKSQRDIDVSNDELMRFNGISDPTKLREGQEIKIPVP